MRVQAWDLASLLSPDVVFSILKQSQVNDPRRLYDFFNWVNSRTAYSKKLSSFSVFAIILCNFQLLAPVSYVSESMIETCKAHVDVLD